eukprot:COSAG01_NODE_39930_length_470_cov_0.778976_1_plen_34_part_01
MKTYCGVIIIRCCNTAVASKVRLHSRHLVTDCNN